MKGQANFHNMAVVCLTILILGIPGFSAQIGMFLGHYGGADSDALYVVQFGGNDVRDALVAASR